MPPRRIAKSRSKTTRKNENEAPTLDKETEVPNERTTPTRRLEFGQGPSHTAAVGAGQHAMHSHGRSSGGGSLLSLAVRAWEKNLTAFLAAPPLLAGAGAELDAVGSETPLRTPTPTIGLSLTPMRKLGAHEAEEDEEEEDDDDEKDIIATAGDFAESGEELLPAVPEAPLTSTLAAQDLSPGEDANIIPPRASSMVLRPSQCGLDVVGATAFTLPETLDDGCIKDEVEPTLCSRPPDLMEHDSPCVDGCVRDANGHHSFPLAHRNGELSGSGHIVTREGKRSRAKTILDDEDEDEDDGEDEDEDNTKVVDDDDDDEEERGEGHTPMFRRAVPANRRQFLTGMQVEARWGRRWFPATVAEDERNGYVQIRWDSDGSLLHLRLREVRPAPPRPASSPPPSSSAEAMLCTARLALFVSPAARRHLGVGVAAALSSRGAVVADTPAHAEAAAAARCRHLLALVDGAADEAAVALAHAWGVAAVDGRWLARAVPSASLVGERLSPPAAEELVARRGDAGWRGALLPREERCMYGKRVLVSADEPDAAALLEACGATVLLMSQQESEGSVGAGKGEKDAIKEEMLDYVYVAPGKRAQIAPGIASVALLERVWLMRRLGEFYHSLSTQSTTELNGLEGKKTSIESATKHIQGKQDIQETKEEEEEEETKSLDHAITFVRKRLREKDTTLVIPSPSKKMNTHTNTTTTTTTAATVDVSVGSVDGVLGIARGAGADEVLGTETGAGTATSAVAVVAGTAVSVREGSRVVADGAMVVLVGEDYYFRTNPNDPSAVALGRVVSVESVDDHNAPGDHVSLRLYEVKRTYLRQDPQTREVERHTSVFLSPRSVTVRVEDLIFTTAVYVVQASQMPHVYRLESPPREETEELALLPPSFTPSQGARRNAAAIASARMGGTAQGQRGLDALFF